MSIERSGYNPRACGALCDECPLNGNIVVPPELNVGAEVLVVGEAPGEQEEKYQRPFVGPSGSELDRALRASGRHRGNVALTNAILCRPPENDLQKLLDVQRRHLKLTGEVSKSPIECCAPRLERELSKYKNYLPLGKTGFTAVTSQTSSILAVRGAAFDMDHKGELKKVLPTLHPAFVLRQQRWAHVFRSDIAKAFRVFSGTSEWKEPDVVYNPEPHELDAFLSDPTRVYTYDIETDGIECLSANIRCIAIGGPEQVMVIGFRSNVTPRHHQGLFLDWYNTPMQSMLMTEILTRFFTNPNIVKVGHNSGYYDRIVIRSQLGCDVLPNIDTMLLHRNVESELPHSLGYVASLYTDAPAWKTDREGNKIALGGESDDELHLYCARDVAITARVLEPLVSQVQMRDQSDVYQMDMKMQEICMAMHTAGMFVDQEARMQKEKELFRLRHSLLQAIKAEVGDNSFNPASVYQMRDLLFKQWKISTEFIDEKDRYTGSGDLSTGDFILRSLLFDPAVPEHQREVLKLIRRYRKCLKVLGTYVVKLRPYDLFDTIDGLGWDDDEDWVDKETRKKYGEEKRGIVNPATGRMYPGYNAHVAVTGRLSSSKPINAQNFPKDLRAMVIAQPGNVLVGADMDQLELRIAAARWGVEMYLRAFADGKDPHSMTAYSVFGEKYCQAAGLTEDQFTRPGKLVGSAFADGKFIGKGDAKSMRDLSKAVQYASQYMAKVETVHKLIQKTEISAIDKATGKPIGGGITDLPYAKLPLRKVRKMRDNWLEKAPQFERGWEEEIQSYRNKGYIREPVTGRRRDFLDGEAPNEIVNFPIQGSAAGLMNRAIIQLYDAIPLHKWGEGTGIINQCHDSIVVECPESEAEHVAALMEECLNQEHPDLPGVRFTASADIGKTWKEVG